MNDLLHTFHDVLGQHGLVPEEIFADGNLHRCPTEGKPHKRNGAYIAHLDKPATLWWCNWETDDQGTFCAEEKQTLSFAEMSAWRERQQSIRRQREEECARRHAEAAQQARQEWTSARVCDASHPYLRRKGIPALEGIRQSRDGTLLTRFWIPQTICKACNASILMEPSASSLAARYQTAGSSFRGSRKVR